MQTIWLEIPRDAKAEARLVQELGVRPLTARLLTNRGLCDPAEADEFLHPSLSRLHDPFGLPDMDKAARRIADAITAKERIYIHGDYDVDGVTSTAVYVRSLTKLGADVIHRIPHRHQDGYDLKADAIQQAYDLGARLTVTTDCGIQARDAVDFANSIGMTVIVTDHHEPGDILPNAYAVVNPRRHDSTYAFAPLAGVGVAYKTMQAVTRLLKPEWENAFIQNFLDLVALGTVADVMPLLGENRILTSFGLEALRCTKKVGLRALLDCAGIDTSEKLNSESIGYGLAPRINAVGRLDDAARALDLLLTADSQEAQVLVAHLNDCNQKRQITQRKIQAEAVVKVITKGIAGKSLIMVSDRNWNPGVIGIVAGKLVEQFHRPAIVVAENADGTWGKGSGRSINAFDLFTGITTFKDLLETCGGHCHAAGLSLQMSNFDEFYARICEHADSVLKPDDFIPRLRLDALVDIDSLTDDLMEEWEQFHPHGQSNPAPILGSQKVKLTLKKRMGKDMSHIKLKVSGTKQGCACLKADCLGWGLAEEWYNKLSEGDEIDVAYAPNINRYQGKRCVQFVIKELAMGGEAPIGQANSEE